MVMRNALRAGALVGCLSSLVFAQTIIDPTSSRSCLGETTVFTADALSGLDTGCEIYYGAITVEWRDIGGNGLLPAISFTNLKNITEGLRFRDSRNDSGDAQALPTLSIDARSILSVGGQLSFEDFGDLKMPQFDSLTAADEIIFSDITFSERASFGSSTFRSLQEVHTISFVRTNVWDVGYQWEAPLKLTNNTAGAGIASIVAQDNSQLSLVHLPGWSETHVNVNISGNTQSLTVEMPDVTSATLSLEGISGFAADGLVRISPPAPVTSGKPARRQEAADGTSSITNSGLTQLNLPSLQSIEGTLEILNNSQLTSIVLEGLQSVTGDLQIAGNAIDEIDLGQLNTDNLGGELNVAAAPNFDCDSLGVSGDAVTCGNSEQNIPSPTSSSDEIGHDDGDSDQPDDSEDGNAGGGGLSTGAKAGIGVGVGLGVLLVVVIAFFIFRRSRRSRSPRNVDPDGYGKDLSPSEAATSPTGYSKVPSEMRTEEVGRLVSGRFSYDNGDHHNAGAGIGVGRISNDRGRHRHQPSDAAELEEQQGERFEMEEQQGMRHEMDARSLPDIDLDDESPERRSLEDIERSRNSGPSVGMGPQTGPVSPVG